MIKDGNLRIFFRTKMRDVDWMTVESSATTSGAPDMNGCLDGREIWVELKKSLGFRPTIQPSQIGWAMRRTTHGGRVWFAIRKNNTITRNQIDELWLIEGHHAIALAKDGMENLPNRRWVGGPLKWDWAEVKETLFS